SRGGLAAPRPPPPRRRRAEGRRRAAGGGRDADGLRAVARPLRPRSVPPALPGRPARGRDRLGGREARRPGGRLRVAPQRPVPRLGRRRRATPPRADLPPARPVVRSRV